MDLDLVEQTGRDCALRDAGAMHHHVLFARSLLGRFDSGRKVTDEMHIRPPSCPIGCRSPAEDVDPNAVVMVTVPTTGRIEGAATSQDGPGRHEFVDHVAISALHTSDGVIEIDLLVRPNPFVQAGAAITESVVNAFIGTRNKAVEGHRKRNARWGT